MDERESQRCHTTHLGKESIDDEIEETTKELISHQDGKEEVAKHNWASELACIWPMTSGGKDDPSQVQCHDKGKELPIGVEPELPTDPTTNFLLCGFGFVRLGQDNGESSEWRWRHQTFLFRLGSHCGLI